MSDPFKELFGSSPLPSSSPESKTLDNPLQPFQDLFKTQAASNSEIWKVPNALGFSYDQYQKQLSDYEYIVLSDKTDFGVHRNPSIGYKCHLNVAPEHVVQVATYLKAQDYCHKYFHGGELEDGKVFTVYLGSKRNVEHLMPRFYEDLKPYLLPPSAEDEVEFAPRIVGRFCAAPTEFHQYGSQGISYLKDWEQKVAVAYRKGDQAELQKVRDQAVAASSARLQKLYGDYYGGGITPHVPSSSQ